MKRLVLAMLCVLGAGLLGGPWLVAQAGLKQTGYLKASNPGMFDHFGEGGALDGHTGHGIAISGDGNTVALTTLASADIRPVSASEVLHVRKLVA